MLTLGHLVQSGESARALVLQEYIGEEGFWGIFIAIGIVGSWAELERAKFQSRSRFGGGGWWILLTNELWTRELVKKHKSLKHLHHSWIQVDTKILSWFNTECVSWPHTVPFGWVINQFMDNTLSHWQVPRHSFRHPLHFSMAITLTLHGTPRHKVGQTKVSLDETFW